jgi:hypothetical protein
VGWGFRTILQAQAPILIMKSDREIWGDRAFITIKALEVKMLDCDCQDLWTRIRMFFSSEWCMRVWCVQEMILARKARLVLGDIHKDLKSSIVFTFCVWFGKQSKFEDIPAKLIQSITNISEAHRRFDLKTCDDGPLRTMSTFENLSATDSRDKIYGLSGLMEYDSLDVDYSRTVAEVYTRFVLDMMHYGFDVLTFVDHQVLSKPSAFPSWAPRWDKRWVDHSLRIPRPDRMASDSRYRSLPRAVPNPAGLPSWYRQKNPFPRLQR